MNLGTILQAIIFIVLIYLLLALLTSELQEYLAAYFEIRAKRFKQSVFQMLGEEDWNGHSFVNHIKTYRGEDIKAGKKVFLKQSEIFEIKEAGQIFSTNNQEFIWHYKKKNSDNSITVNVADSNTVTEDPGDPTKN